MWIRVAPQHERRYYGHGYPAPAARWFAVCWPRTSARGVIHCGGESYPPSWSGFTVPGDVLKTVRLGSVPVWPFRCFFSLSVSVPVWPVSVPVWPVLPNPVGPSQSGWSLSLFDSVSVPVRRAAWYLSGLPSFLLSTPGDSESMVQHRITPPHANKMWTARGEHRALGRVRTGGTGQHCMLATQRPST